MATQIGREPDSVKMGFSTSDNVMTIARHTGGGAFIKNAPAKGNEAARDARVTQE